MEVGNVCWGLQCARLATSAQSMQSHMEISCGEFLMDTTDLILWGLAVVIGLVATFMVAKSVRTRKQVQKTGRNSVSIQSGRDTKINND